MGPILWNCISPDTSSGPIPKSFLSEWAIILYNLTSCIQVKEGLTQTFLLRFSSQYAVDRSLSPYLGLSNARV